MPQLIGEELITILPFLALLALATSVLGWSRRTTVLIGWVGSALLFAALHLPTYDWNILQCLVLIGLSRLVLTLAYFVTKNLWVSSGAHILNDWIMLGLPLVVLGGAAAV